MTNPQNDKPKKKMTKSDWIGAVVGFFIASIIFQMGSFGFIPAFIIAYGSYWIAKQIALSFMKETKPEPSTQEEQKTVKPSKEAKTSPNENKKALD